MRDGVHASGCRVLYGERLKGRWHGEEEKGERTWLDMVQRVAKFRGKGGCVGMQVGGKDNASGKKSMTCMHGGGKNEPKRNAKYDKKKTLT